MRTALCRIAAAAGMLTGSAAPAQIAYSVMEIPLHNGAFFGPVDLNDSGLVAGTVGPNGGQPAVWSAASGFTLLPPLPGGAAARAEAINNAGQVVGTSTYAGLIGAQAVRWDADGSVHTLSGVGRNSYGHGINEAGDVVGEMYGIPSNEYTSGFFWTPSGGAQGMGDNGYFASPVDVNASGMAVGTRIRPEFHNSGEDPDYRAFVWDAPGGMRDVPLGGWERTFGYAINDRGQVVGTAQNDAFVWDPVIGMILLQTGGYGQAYDINEAGLVVGWGSSTGPFVWDAAHGTRALNSLIEHPIEADTVSAIAINNVGQILVAAVNYVNNPLASHYFVLTPVPAPSAGPALLPLVARRKRRRR